MPRNLLTGGAFRSKLFSELIEPDAPAPALAAGTRIGVWRIEHLLGRGGMSEVYLARRDADDFEQTVAIKLIAADVDAADLLRAERRHLGRLRHPGLATLIDGGELEGGKVWLAMEYVDGQPIDTYAESHALDWTARVALLEQLCEAVGHAHMHLLVHRDIKPSNVLVDDAGHARLIDFGIAVAVEGGATTQRWLTPGYAAPEQLRGDPLTTATDIFQLGQLLRALTADDVLPRPPPRPVRQDLGRIIDRASHDEPARRHASAAELSADLAALRALRPLPVRRSGLFQRAQLWRLRHAWVPWAAVPLLLLLAVTATQAVRSGLREADERAMALREEQVSSAIGAFFIDLFNEPVTADDGGAGVTALLDRGQRRLHERPNTLPEVQAALLSQLADANVQMERRDMAVELLEEAIRGQRAAGLGAPLAHSLAALARLRMLAGEADAGARLADEASALLAADTRASRDRFLALTRLGEYHVNSFGHLQGERALRAALQVGVERYGEDSPELYRTERLLLELLRNQWRIDEALPVAEALSERCERAFGADDSRCVTDFIHLQRTLALAGRHAEARGALEALWAARAGWDGKLRNYREHAVLFGLSEVQAIEGDYFGSLDTFLASLCPLERAEGRGGRHWTSDRVGMALLLVELGAAGTAHDVAAEAQGDPTDPATLEGGFRAMHRARIQLAAAGRVTPEVASRLREAAGWFREVFGPSSYYAARAELALAQVEAARGEVLAAGALADSAARARPQGLHFYHPQLMAEIDTLRSDLAADPGRRVAHLRRAEARLRASHGDDHVLVAAAFLRRAQAEADGGQPIDASAVREATHTLAAQQVEGSLAVERALGLLASAETAHADVPRGRRLPDLDPTCP